MGKVRAKNVKTKEGSDFAKKKVKVGRKVKRANLTEIKVKSKHIHVPLQNQVSFADIEDVRVAVTLVIKQLHHYSESTRTSALHKLKDIVNTNPIELLESSFITLVLPEVIELIFNVEKDVRVLVVDVLSIMLVKYKSEDFLAVISVLITYICSGLTHLHKGIRKDSLILLKAISDRYPELLLPYLEKVLTHMLSLINDSFQSATTTSSVVTVGHQSNNSKTNHSSNIQIHTTTSNAIAMKKDNGKKDNRTMFVLILEVLSSVLNNMFKISLSSTSNADLSTNHHLVDMKYDITTSYNAIVVLQSISLNTSSSSSSSKQTSNRNNMSHLLSHELVVNVLQHMSQLWQLLVVNNNDVSVDIIHTLIPITNIILNIYVNYSSGSSYMDWNEQFKLQLVSMLFKDFPYISHEAIVSASGSAGEIQGNRLVEKLNIALCELAFVHLSAIGTRPSEEDVASTGSTTGNLQDTASNYLLQRLTNYVETLNHIITTQQQKLPQQSKQQQKQKQSEAETISITEFEKQSTLVIFKSLQRMMSKNTTKSLYELLVLLHKLFYSLLAIPHSMLRSYNYMIKSAVDCLCSIVDRIKSDLSEDFSEAVYVYLIQSVCKAVELVLTAQWDLTTTLSRLIHAMLALLQGKAFSMDTFESSVQLQDCMKLMIETHKLFWNKQPHHISQNHEQYQSKHGFERCDDCSQYRLLDIYVYLQFTDSDEEDEIFDMSNMILDYLISYIGQVDMDQRPGILNHQLELQSYFLRLLFERRQLMNLDDFMDLLINSIRNVIHYKYSNTNTSNVSNSYSVTIESSSSSKNHGKLILPCISEFHSNCWYVHEVSNILSLMTSSEHPDRIVSFLQTRIDQWILDCSHTNNTTNNSNTMISTIEIEHEDEEKDCSKDSLSDSNHSLSLIEGIYSKCAIIILLEGLLKPWVSPPSTSRTTSTIGGRYSKVIDQTINIVNEENSKDVGHNEAIGEEEEVDKRNEEDIEDIEDIKVNHKQAINITVQGMVKLLISLLQTTFTITSTDKNLENVLEGFLIESIARTLSISIDTTSFTSSNNQDDINNNHNNNEDVINLKSYDNTEYDYIIFKNFLNELQNNSTITTVTCNDNNISSINIFRGMYQIIHNSKFNPNLLIIYKVLLSEWIDKIIQKERMNIEQNMMESTQFLLLQNIAKDIIASF